MFKVIKVDFYDDFSCIMSACPDSCCDEDWDIYVDDDAIRLYEEAGIPDLYSMITSTKPHKIIKKDNKCPFGTPDGLCFLHRDYGEEYLSNTCRSYPRFVSAYGDVYLETLGMSCPATVMQLIRYPSLVVFPYNVYYEENDEIGKIPERTKAEEVSYSVIEQFEPGKSITDVYIKMMEKGLHDGPNGLWSRGRLIKELFEAAEGTPSERYVNELFSVEYRSSLSDEESEKDGGKLYDIEKRLNDSNELFSANVNRMLMFEHMMLESREDHDSTPVLIRGLIVWSLLLMAFECCNEQAEKYGEDELVNVTHKLMRIVDHGGTVLDKMQKNRI